ncbi:MAG: glycoside hydrolase family 5 protein [Lachnospira sp.]|nr:glycoside hydrolase family 5 protein [Lachnospira sp.]
MRRRILQIMAIIMCVVIVSGCGDSTGGNTGKNDNSNRDETQSAYDLEDMSAVVESTGYETVPDAQESTAVQDETDSKNPKYMTTMQVTKDMGIGINLGNTFEACGSWITGNTVTAYETAWGSPVITKDIIAGYAREGFKTLRIPVAWSNMMGADYTISPALIARVKEVVGWAIECDMYVILNIHWDGGWWADFPVNKANCMAKYKAVWNQLTKEFGGYDHRLIFESLNEEGCWDSVWNRYANTTAGKAEAYGLLNEINQVFVDLVRSSGNNNSDRHLLIAGYATDVILTCDEAFVMPKDSANRCAVSVHYYTPANYCVLTENSSWAQVKTTWGNDEDKAELVNNMNLLKVRFIDKGIPVIMGEFGVVMDNKSKENATLFLTAVAKEAISRDICPVLWDITCDYSFYNRKTCAMSEYATLKENLNNLIK